MGADDASEGAEAIVKRCAERGLRMTEQRRVIAQALAASDDHPDAEELHRRASEIDARISLATVYRTVKLFEDSGIIDRRDFRDGRARYEDAERAHHDHLIDIDTGEVCEFVDDEIERLQRRIAARLGYDLVDHRLVLYGTKRGEITNDPADAKPTKGRWRSDAEEDET